MPEFVLNIAGWASPKSVTQAAETICSEFTLTPIVQWWNGVYDKTVCARRLIDAGKFTKKND
jgi:hypothetical protein